ncbi:MAG: hypothetical protein IJS08_11275 [Victivallales bacterium]|nr:hypothetical protein [Victivallales bacterium]
MVEEGMGHPHEQSGAFVAALENVLDLYCKPYDECPPLVCLDEMPKQLIGDLSGSLAPSCLAWCECQCMPFPC